MSELQLNIPSVGGSARQRGRTVEIKVETVTPEKAKEWLTHNVHNRKASNSQVRKFAWDMGHGDWGFTGDPIRFDVDGNLIDGQHRLMACMMSGVSFDCLVIRNMPTITQIKLDQGRNRRVADHLSLRDGIVNPVALAATARQLLRIKGNGMGARPTIATVLHLIDRHPKMEESVAAVGKPLGMHPSLLAAIHYIGCFLLDDRDAAERFISVFQTGESTYPGDPAHLWRERWLADERKHVRMTMSARRIGTIHAWNLFRKGEKLAQFRLPDDAKIDGLDTDAI